MGGREKYVKKLKSVSYLERWQTSKRQLGLCSVEIHWVFYLRLRLMFQTKDNGRYRYQERIILKPKTATGDIYTTWGGRWQQQRSFVKIKRGRNWKKKKKKGKTIWLWSCTTSMICTIFWMIIFVTIYKIFFHHV